MITVYWLCRAYFSDVGRQQIFVNWSCNPLMQQQVKSVTFLLQMFRDTLSLDERCNSRSVSSNNTPNLFSHMQLPFLARTTAPAKDTVCLFGVGSEDTLVVLQALKTYGITPIQKSSSKARLEDVTPADTGTTYLVVNVDAIGELEDAVDELIAFRKRCPNVVVVMISAFVLSDDLGSYRKLICDATLRSPISQGRFEQSVIAARLNKFQNMTQVRPDTWRTSRFLEPKAS